MTLFNNQISLFKYFIYTSILLISLVVFTNVFYIEEESNGVNDVIVSKITYSDEFTSINVDYPRFKNNKINKIVTDYIYSYVKDFKSSHEKSKILDINYELYYFDDYVNIVFSIENTLDITKNKNLLIDLKDKSLKYISSLYDKDYLSNEINGLVYYKYSTDIYEAIKYSNVDNHTYIINDNKIDIYFNDIVFENTNYIPYVSLSVSGEVFSEEGVIYDGNQKYMAFTFDDGPSEYTEEILKTLELNASSATFFMLGNRMKYNENIIKSIYSSNSEIASHTYSHKNLSTLSKEEIINEINSSTIIYNEITNDNIKYLRPPYGGYNELVKSVSAYPLILWNIDTKDWLYRDSNKIYNSVMKNACDGCIVIMHDIYKETSEAVKMLIPALRNSGYEVVSISTLSEIKNKKLNNGEIITNID